MTDIGNTLVKASGVGTMRREEIGPKTQIIHPPDVFALGHVVNTLESIKNPDFSFEVLSEETAILIEGIKHKSGDIWALGKIWEIQIGNGRWRIGRGLSSP